MPDATPEKREDEVIQATTGDASVEATNDCAYCERRLGGCDAVRGHLAFLIEAPRLTEHF